jgi:hypothetical protein
MDAQRIVAFDPGSVNLGVAAASIDGRAVRFEWLDNKALRAQGEKASQDEVCGRLLVYLTDMITKLGWQEYTVVIEQQPVTYSQLEVRQVESALHNCFTFLRVRDRHRVRTVSRKSRTPHWGGKQGAVQKAKEWLEACPAGLAVVQGRQASHVADAMCLVMREGKCESPSSVTCELRMDAVILDLT